MTMERETYIWRDAIDGNMCHLGFKARTGEIYHWVSLHADAIHDLVGPDESEKVNARVGTTPVRIDLALTFPEAE